MYMKKSNQKRLASGVSKKGAQSQNEKEQITLNKLLGLKREGIAEKYFSMTEKQKGQKNCILDNYNDLDEMIHNYLYTNHSTTNKPATGMPLPNVYSEKNLKNWNRSHNLLESSPLILDNSPLPHQVNGLRSQIGDKDMSESQSDLGFSTSSQNYAKGEKTKGSKELNNHYNNNMTRLEYNFINSEIISTSLKKEDQRLQNKQQDHHHHHYHRHNNSKGNQHSEIGKRQMVQQNNYTNSNTPSNQDNSSNILDNNTTNNTITIRSNKLNSTPSNHTETSTPSYAMGTIVSNNKTNQARRFSRTRPVTAAISKNQFIYETNLNNNVNKNSNNNNNNYNNEDEKTKSVKPWLRHELFTKKQKGELMYEYNENSEMNTQTKQSQLIERNRDEAEEEVFEDCTEKVKYPPKDITKTSELSKTVGSGFQGYNQLLRSESSKKFDQNACDNIIKDCENIINKIQKRDNQQLYNSQRKENDIFGSSQQQQQKMQQSQNILGGRGSSIRNSFRVSSSIHRPQSVKKMSQNNLMKMSGESRFEDVLLDKQDDEINSLQEIANTLLLKKLNSNDSAQFKAKRERQGSYTNTSTTGQRLTDQSYSSNQYMKEKQIRDERNEKQFYQADLNDLSQIKEQQEGEQHPLNNDDDDEDTFYKSSPNIQKQKQNNNLIVRSQSSAKESSNNRLNGKTSVLTDKKEELKATSAISKNVKQLTSNNNSNTNYGNQNRNESKRQLATAIIDINQNITQTVSSANVNSNALWKNSLKRNSDTQDNNDKENIKSIATTMKINEREDKRAPLGTNNNKPSRPATAAMSKSGSEVSSANNLTTNKLMERYDIKCSIGKGSYAVVKLAKDTHTDNDVAIKMYDKYKLIDPQKRNNVKREVAILNKLQHVNIIQLYTTIDTRSSLNLVMEYISSVSLRQFMKALDGRQLEERYARTIFKQLVSAVQFCHEWEVIHRDIKLENIMLDVQNNHQIKLIDFGFAIRIPPEKKLNIFCGTPSYMSPEITKKKEYFGKPADIWSLGVVLYALVCGRFPYKGKDDNDLFKKIQSGDYKISSNASQSSSKLISKLLRQNPIERPTAKEILQDRWFME